MAEEEDILEELEAAEATGGKKSMGMIIGIIVGLLVLGGGGYYAYITFFQEKPAEELPVEGEEGAAKAPPGRGACRSRGGRCPPPGESRGRHPRRTEGQEEARPEEQAGQEAATEAASAAACATG